MARLWLDATYLKVREGGRIIGKAVIIAVAVNGEACSARGSRNMPNGKREVLGVATGPSEPDPKRVERHQGFMICRVARHDGTTNASD
jgi:transposase-like protein